MRKTLKISALASMIGVSLLGGAADTTAHAAQISKATNSVTTYLIEFRDEGALHYKGGIPQLRGTAPDPLGIGQFNPASQDVEAYRSYLRQRQATELHEMASAIGRNIDVTHTYETSHSGVAARLTAKEAARIARLPGVKSVKAAEMLEMDTFRGPAFIGAETMWNAVVPGGLVNRGRGVTIGVLDSGANSTHPSFADDPMCGFSSNDHKLLSARDCSATTNGICSGPTPEATDSGHGVHTASTAGGNQVFNSAVPSPMLPPPYTSISGVAPCASLRTYRVCNEPNGNCSSADIIAAVDNSILDGVNVINFSISGGTAPWGGNERRFLDAVNANIFIAASAGNTSASITDPVGQVNHRGPWTMTVAASTSDVNIGSGLSATNVGAPANTQNRLVTLGSHMNGVPVPYTNVPMRVPANITGCTASGGFPANYFSGSAALISRGTCSFTEKITNAAAAGALYAFIYNNTFGTLGMTTTGATIPAYGMTQADGVAMKNYIAANGATPTTTDLAGSIAGPVQGDVLAGFSFRGPTPGPLADLTKPDITGPGVNILAAGRVADGNYFTISGTSMSSPHVAGAAALVRAAHPFWTPMEVKSAMQLTAKVDGFKENGVDPWNIDDVGSGRVDLTKAAYAGLVMNETYDRFLAADPQGGSINIKELNLPSVRNASCYDSCSFTRTLVSKIGASAEWTATYVGDPDLGVTITPSTFTIAASGTQAITINVALPFDTVLGSLRFGEILLTPTDNTQSPVEHITVAIDGQGLPDQIFADGFDTPDPPVCLSVEGRTSTGSFGSGDPDNSIVTLNIGAGNAMTGLSYDTTIETVGTSWLSESQVTFSSSAASADPNAINLAPSGTNSSGIETDSSGGVFAFADYALPNVVAGADGILRFEWNETYTDPGAIPNAIWHTPDTFASCPGLHITCTDQAACDAAVQAASAP
jgi:subtilisin family serine protease